MVTPTVDAGAASGAGDFAHELACEHGVVGWLACVACNTTWDARLFECQMYGRHSYRSEGCDYDGGEVFSCTHCEWTWEARF